MDSKLSAQEHERIYLTRIKPSFFDPVESSSKPKAIIIGGQSGAGKSPFAEAAMNELGGPTAAVRIDTDALRPFHPKFIALASTGKEASTHTQKDAQDWRDRLEHDAIAARKNLVIDTTMGWVTSLAASTESLKAAGYSVEARVVSAHRTESQLGILSRYYEQLEKFGMARYVGMDYHDQVYPRIPQSLKTFEENKLVEAIHVIGRDGKMVHSQQLTAEGKWDTTHMSSTALTEDRERRGRDPQIVQQHFKAWDALEKVMDKLDVKQEERAEVAAIRKAHELELTGRVSERSPRAQALLTMGLGEIRVKFPNDASLQNAALTVHEAEKFASAALDSPALSKLVVDDVRLQMADRLDKNEKISRPIEKEYQAIQRELERKGPTQRSREDDDVLDR